MASASALRAASSVRLQHCLGQTGHPHGPLGLSGGVSWISGVPICQRRHEHRVVSPAVHRSGVRAVHEEEGESEPAWKRLQQAASTSSSGDPVVDKLGDNSRLVLGKSSGDADWRRLDEKVHKYPTPRFFTSIGTGDQDFAASMVSAVESVIGSLPEERVVQRYSEKGKYISVKIGPIMCQSSDQVVAIYQAMRADSRMQYFI